MKLATFSRKWYIQKDEIINFHAGIIIVTLETCKL